ncbi:MAG: iron ABC transporter permease [Spirochaetota bacterium]|nr:iron ABC transporter permease [Spirochaetota bacterium]
MKNSLKLTLLLLLGIFIIIISISLGSTFISPLKLISTLVSDNNNKLIEYQIILNIRLPRILMALIIGASLSVSGAIFQAILKNPLSDPLIIGVSGGAALGATIAIVLSMPYFYITLFALIGSIAIISFLYFISTKRLLGSTSLILSGIALSFILQAGILLIFTLAKSEDVHKAMFWLMGDMSLARFSELWKMGIFSCILILLSMTFYKQLNIISFGERFAKNLGINERDIRNIFLIASLLTAISVTLAGVIGFIGLIIPHVMRYIFGSNHLRLVPVSAIGGALFLMISDTIGRSIVPPYEIPVGIITGFIGGAFFLLLLFRKGLSRNDPF